MTRPLFLLLAILFVAGTAGHGETLLFRRSDSNIDGRFDLSDATHTLRSLFFGKPTALSCADAADSNDDGRVDLTDAVYALGFLFLEASPPPPPYAECGYDPTRDALGCEEFPGCDQAPPSGEIRFGDVVNYLADCNPTSVALDDVDGDDVLDLLYTNYCSGTSIRLGAGDGSFAEATEYPLVPDRWPVLPAAIATGDFNADGKVDFATADPGPESEVSILLGAGGGSFNRAVTFPLNGRGASSLALGDLNADGALDVVSGFVAGEISVSIALGAGDGTFHDARGFGADPNGWSIALGDVESNGTLDVAALGNGSAGAVSILLGIGDGTLGQPMDYAVGGSSPWSVTFGDFDRDDTLDLAVGHGSGVSVLAGRGDETFGAAVTCLAGKFARFVLPADIDADGSLDLTVVHLSRGSVSVSLGFGDGTFGEGFEYPVGESPMSLAPGDLDLDGRPDLAVANNQSNDISVLLSR